ncbi:hypothetical protein PVAND_014126 [Polypedilum vanderplanki]|uniref:Protein misato n=1 Tax=Polypedilum vanderplanki TaxID=319348 RepID=A0A9J6CT71_POLVA|nr:hypothetical protein PVAND_014126 [Polypedilum vanderplanki]
MSVTREIITLQLGNYANFVGTHFWNTQEHSFNYDPEVEVSEINHDVLFREGNYNRNVTFTPRMLLLDLKGSLKFVQESGNLYTENQIELNNPEKNVLSQIRETIAWQDDNIEVMESEEIPMPSYQKSLMENGIAEGEEFNLKETVNNWPDFMYTRYHPRSINIIKNYEYSEQISTFDTFTVGTQLWNSPLFEDEYCDKIRNYIEECDQCQGFQTIFDAIDGFSGVSMKCIEHLEDEYSKSILAFPLIPSVVKNFQFSDEGMSETIRLINIAFSYAKLSEFSSLFIPLSTMERGWRNVSDARKFHNISYDSSNLYHCSSILSSFIDTMSIQYRLREITNQNYLSNLCAQLNIYGRKMCGAKISFPFPMNEKEDLIDFLDRFNSDLMQCISPNTTIGTDRIIQSVTLRGIPKNRLKKPFEKAKDQMKMAAYKCSSISEMIQLYYQCSFYASLSHVASAESAMKIKSPFPKEFFSDNRLTSRGFLKEFQNDEISQVNEVPVMTSVQNSNELSNTLENLYTQVERVKLAKIPRFIDAGLEKEEYKELLEQLLVFKEQYDDNEFL